MRYRRLTYRYATMVESTVPTRLELWPTERLHVLIQTRFRPDVDTYETATAVEIVIDLAGVDEDQIEVQLFEDVVIVQGDRRLPPSDPAAVFHSAGIRQGPFHVAVPLPAPVDADRVDASYERGLLRITMGKRAEGR